MLDRVTSMQVFARVAATGGFSAAARALGLSRTMTTRHVGALEERLKDHLEGDDGLLIQQVEVNAVLLNTALRWFRKRRLEVASDAANVVAFPVSQIPEAKAA